MNPLRMARAVGLLILLIAPHALAAEEPVAPDNPYADRPQTCKGCHATLGPDDALKLADGTEISVYVEADAIGHSVHADELTCTDCHRTMSKYPHEPVQAETDRQYRLDMAQTCNQCHYDYFTHMLDSMHFQQIREEKLEAPTCVDCHGNHDIKDPSEPRQAISDQCAECHEEVAETYAASIHGESLAKGTEHAPTCTDCHGAHAIAPAKNVEFHAGSYTICANCHGDPEKMADVGLSPNVLDTYMDDFHGMSNLIYTEVGHIPERPMATCGDCHGVHDVQKLAEGEEESVARERVAEMCNECHEGSTEAFAGAWMGHEDPSLFGSPLVWLVMWGYRILIPVMILGLLVHIFMHFYRAAVESVEEEAKTWHEKK